MVEHGSAKALVGQEEPQAQIPRRKSRGAEGLVPVDMEEIMACLDQIGTSMTEGI